ncbi:MAG: cobyrinate a,c-diamide synthase [Pseudomonadota bacterium]
MNYVRKPGFLIAAPSSGSGKTVITLGLLRAFRNKGLKVVSAKAGPDYIDPAFHKAATGEECVNLDPWAMNASNLGSLSQNFFAEADIALVEGMMGLFDGAADGSGSAADLAVSLGLPVVLVVDASRMSFSVSALVRGFRDHRPDLNLAGVILNRVGSSRHEIMLRKALADLDVTVFGAVPKLDDLELPSRHLGLVQASEHDGLEIFITHAADHIAAHCDLETLGNLGWEVEASEAVYELPPLGQRIAIAQDEAFAFCYPHILSAWRNSGAELSFFSPLHDQAPEDGVDAVYLPGGYPELHADRIANASGFIGGLTTARDWGVAIYGECGGYMVLGEGLVDAEGQRHSMAGLLKLETSFEKRKLHLGYRRLKADNFPLGEAFTAHEFHYTSATKEEGQPLFEAQDALGNALGNVGLREGSVMGSYMHVIDKVG